MSLDDLLDLICSSRADAWHLVQAGTTYTDRFNAWMVRRDEPTALEVDQHPSLAVYRPDVDVRIAWGAQRDDVGFLRQLSGPMRTEWNTLSSRREATPLLLDAFYRGALVHRTTYLWGDGARFPYPRPREVGGHTRLVASRRESHLVGLVEEISEGSTEAYWQRVEQVGFLLVDDELEDPNR